MGFIKLADSEIVQANIQEFDKLANDIDLDIENRMAKFANDLKVIAPRADQFLYFTCVMMHAAEASCYNPDGSPKKTSQGEEVKATWEKVGEESVKWVCNDPNIKPYKNNNCFLPGTSILMGDGSVKNIEDVKVGDEVVTHKNRVKKVVRSFKNEHNGEINIFSIGNSLPLFCTPEHPFYITNITSNDSNSYRALRYGKFEYKFVEAKDLGVHDFLCAPVLKEEVETDITPNKARLLGLWAAEGSLHRNEVIFSFGAHEENTLARTASILIEKEFGTKAKIKVHNSKAEVSFSNSDAALFFEKHVGKGSAKKKLSKEIVFGPKNNKLQFLTGWLEGDGSVDKFSGKLVGTTISKDLASQVLVMLNSLGINNTIHKQEPTTSTLVSGRQIVGKYPAFRIKIPYNETQDIVKNSENLNRLDKDVNFVKMFRFTDDHRIHRIYDKDYADYNGSVYNIEVEDDHSYVANGIIVHNCDIFPESELKIAYKNWIGRPLCLDHQSQSVDKIRGVIVDTVYDEAKKRVIALCALDRKNYPDLADKVKSGVATNVSMGTAVGKAICTDCHTVARTERDFCQHMRAKSCYGEINMELSPIELSLVVSGADPGAKVKHIIASNVEKAAEMLTDYLNIKEASTGISTQDLESVKKDLANLTEKISILTSKEDESEAISQTRSTTMEGAVPAANDPSTQVNAPSAMPMYASELQQAVLGAQTKIASLQENLSRLTKNEETTMTNKKNAYFQGTEEPKPGQQQYPVDPANEQGRLMDKNLHGPAPFPNTGDVEGLYPGDDQKKKELQRLADENERAEFRKAALKKAKEQLAKKSYFQGTEEPTDGGNPQYEVDPLNDKARQEDKTLVGAPPFPGVGDVEGLYGDDMKTKEMLSRASLRARFKKATAPDGRIDKAASTWVVLANDTPILQATVDQITKGNSDSLYEAIATERFGRSLLDRIQNQGFKATASALLKKEGQPVAPAPAAPTAPEGAPEAPAPEAPVEEPVADLNPPEEVGDEVGGDPSEIVGDLTGLLDEMGEKLSDLESKVSGPVEEDAEGLADIPAAGDDEFAAPPEGAAMPKSTAQLQGMRKRVNGMLQEGIRETVASLKKHRKELNIAKGVYANYSAMNKKQRDYLNGLTLDAVKDARAVLADTDKLIKAVVKYAEGTSVIEKRAEADKSKIKKKADDQETVETLLGDIDFDTPSDTSAIKAVEEALSAAEEEINETRSYMSDEADLQATLETQEGKEVPVELGDGSSISLASKEKRAEARVKLAQKGLLGFNDLSQQAHPGGSASAVDAGNLDVAPSVDGAAFHVHKDLKTKMEGLANMPPRVRKQAERIQELVSEGRLDPARVDELTSFNVDPEAVKYWKAMWGEAKDTESNEFANRLTQEHAQAKQAQEMEDYKGRVKRAYDMAHQMVKKNMIDQSQVEYQVGEIMKYNQAGYDSLKRLIDKQAAVKTASVPNVGLLSSGDVILPAAQQPTQAGGSDIKGFFDNYFNSKGLKF